LVSLSGAVRWERVGLRVGDFESCGGAGMQVGGLKHGSGDGFGDKRGQLVSGMYKV
jgi:hypothetical protein